MALVTTSELVGTIKGSIGGTTFSNSRAGLIAKRKSGTHKNYTNKQANILKNHVFIIQQWQQLTLEQQLLWNDYANTYPQINRWGVETNLTGLQWFSHMNNLKYAFNQTLLNEPPSRVAAITIPDYFLIIRPNELSLLVMDGLNAPDNLIYIFISPPSQLSSGSNRGKLRLVKTLNEPNDYLFDLKSEYESCYNINWNELTANSEFKLQVSIYAVNKNSWMNSIAVNNNFYINQHTPLFPLTHQFIDVTGISDESIINALNNLELSMIINDLIDSTIILYPFVGGTSELCKYNFMDSSNTDEAFRLTFVGGWTFDADGATPNGTNAYANTHMIPNDDMGDFSATIQLWSLTANTFDGFDFGCQSDPDDRRYQGSLNFSGRMLSRIQRASGNDCNSTPPNTSGNFQYVLRNNSYIANWRNGANLPGSPNTTTDNMARSVHTFYLGALNYQDTPVLYCNRKFGLVIIGAALDDSKLSKWHEISSDFMNSLNRI